MTVPSKTPPIAVSVHCVSDKMQATFELFFKKRTGGRFYISELNEAAMVIVDIDGKQGMETLQEIKHEYPTLSIIAISLFSSEKKNLVLLEKPFKANQLMSALTAAARRLKQPAMLDRLKSRSEKPDSRKRQASIERTKSGRLTSIKDRQQKSRASAIKAAEQLAKKEITIDVGRRGDISINDNRTKIALTRYQAKTYLQGYIGQAIALSEETGEVVKLSFTSGYLVLDAKQDWLRSALTELDLKLLCNTPSISNVKLSRLKSSTGLLGDEFNLYQLKPLLWKVSLWSSRGRICDDIALDQLIKLRQWPDLNSVEAIPHAIRIAALWSTGRYSLLQTAELLNIPQCHVFSFYSAVRSLGLLLASEDGPKPESRTDLVAQVLPKPLHHFFQKVINRLQRGANIKA